MKVTSSVTELPLKPLISDLEKLLHGWSQEGPELTTDVCRARTGSPAFTSSYFPRSTTFMFSGTISSIPRGSLLGPVIKDFTLCLIAD